MQRTITALSLASLGLLVFALAAPVVDIVRSSVGRERRQVGRGDVLVLACGIVFFALLFLRPHQHTFSGLDVSAYRLMGRAFAEGRPLKSVDENLLSLPRPHRGVVLYRPEHHKTTRDQSFLIESMETCRTRPFFYPLLPFAMAGFDRLVPGDAADYLVPSVGWAMAFCLLCVGAAHGGAWGALVAAMLLVGSPWPVWFFRGCYPETVGSVLIGLPLMAWMQTGGASRRLPLYAFALGLAVSFHPVMIVLALPVLGVITVVRADESRWATLLGGAGFGFGLLPVYLMTRYVTAPYGFLDLKSLVASARLSTPIFITLAGALAAGGVLLLVVGFRSRIVAAVGRLWQQHPVWSRLLLVAAWMAPTLVLMLSWRRGVTIRYGLGELAGGLRLALGAALGLACLTALVFPKLKRARLAWTVVFISLPVFLYLKGWDRVGLWSQRRLLPSVLLACAVSVPVLAYAVRRLLAVGRWKNVCHVLLLVAMGVAGIANAVRWPAPYLVRQEAGADDWVASMRERFHAKTVFFDYHPYSVPFAVSGRERVFGLGRYALDSVDLLSAWVAANAAGEEVWWATAYDSPGVEEGVRLQDVDEVAVLLPRVHAKAALPAERRDKQIALRLLRAVPIEEGDGAATDRILDGGVLGLRGPWGRMDRHLDAPGDHRVPAGWSREGSAVLGPVPARGGAVRVTVEGSAGRGDGRNEQVLRVHPPWGGGAIELVLTNGWTRAVGVLARGDAASGQAMTGAYRITSAHPYDPAAEGIKGYAPDLGALIHRVRIEPFPVGE